MTTNFSHTWLSPPQSPCSDLNSRLLWWERCVKRKYNDGSGQLLQGYNKAHTEDGSGNMLCDVMWCSMPSIAHLCETSITSAIKPKISSFQDKHHDRGYNLPIASTDHALQRPHVQTDKKDVSKKRIHMATSVDTLCGAVQACDLDIEDGVLRLKEALKFQKSALRRLYRDLEEERRASATAANEVMAMINRLQEEKSAALVESLQYKRYSEEKEAYSQEVITLLKDTLSSKKHEYYYLQNSIENYRNALMEMKSGRHPNQTMENSHLEPNKENSQPLSLEEKETAAYSVVEPDYFEGKLDEDWDRGDKASSESMCWRHYPLEESIAEDRMGFSSLQCENHILDTAIREQDSLDVNMSILARIARLEEQYACLGQDKALDPESFDLARHKIPEEADFLGFDTTASAPVHKFGLNSLKFIGHSNGLVPNNSEDLEDFNSEDEADNGGMSIYSRNIPSYDDSAGCDSSRNEKQAAKISSAGIDAVKSSLASKDLQNLKVRLQTLEGERAFMKDAIEALRKENMELKLLQEIAQQLQELKGSGYHDQLPFLSFLKRTLSFAGLHGLACTEKRRFFNGCQRSLRTSSNKTQHGGLHHLLNNSLGEEKSICVTRERKVKLAEL